jgi:RNA polymerase sigma-70 factor, ECF subfamily
MLTNATRYQTINVTPPPMQAALVGLLDRIARREQSALAAFYDQTHRLVFGLLLTLLRERSTAERVLLEVYEQVWQQAEQAQNQPHTALAWLLLLTRKLALERLRTLPKQQPVGQWLNANSLAEPSGTAISSECAEVTERRQRVRRALMRLPAEQRRALELACFAGLTCTEIASQLGRTPAEIKTQLAAGMHTLRAHLQPQL